MKIEPQAHHHNSDESTEGSARWRVEVLVAGDPVRASVVLARRRPREVALFDTGLALHEVSLRAALAARGLAPEDVSMVFNTHAHVDHSHNNSLFARARIYCSARDRQWTRALHAALSATNEADAPELLRFYPDLASGAYDPKIVRKMFEIERLLWDDARLGDDRQCAWLEEASLPTGIHAIATPGHVPFHTSFIIDADPFPVLVAGDALLMRDEADAVLQLMPPHDPVAYHRSQLWVLSFHGLIVPGHDAPFMNPFATERP
ncbi:MBL fold metallo-hydrolase [Pyrinomonas sp.]|uniref:MBL fold metallo-hydrolase n=1 Tax=Pyrinomonas sp. TaxID=2080306 RepID=UPI003329D12F